MADPIVVTELNTVLSVVESEGVDQVTVVEEPIVVSEIVTGLKGDTGDAGNRWHGGTVDPTTEGVDGDWYVNRTTWHVWEKVTGTWTDRGTIKGADGEGAGDVVGPASATDGHLAVFDGITGKLLKGGGAPYTLPVATDAVLGGVKVGSGLSITDSVLSATGGSGTDEATVNSLVFAQTY